MTKTPILQIKKLTTSFFTEDGEIPAVDCVSIDVNDGEVVGIVGESGCGKSITSLSIMRLLPSSGEIVNGEILLHGENLTKANEKRMRQIRGREIAMIFQEPMTSLNPLFSIGNQLIEAYRIHNKKISKTIAKEQAKKMLQLVGLPRVDELLQSYPHELSGGMRQRVMIAMAMICDPKVLIADEPTTALDVTIQAQILALMKRLNKQLQMAILLITHDLGVVAEVCERVIVMYAGKIVEEGDVIEVFRNPLHLYTKGLLQSVPDMRIKKERLYSIPGNVPRPGSVTLGCRFYGRCEWREERCASEDPPYVTKSDQHRVRCWLHNEKGGKTNDQSIVTSE